MRRKHVENTAKDKLVTRLRLLLLRGEPSRSAGTPSIVCALSIADARGSPAS